MTRYLATRFAGAIVTLFGITLLIFLAMRVLPGDPLAQVSTGRCTRSTAAGSLISPGVTSGDPSGAANRSAN
jgi:ABC-type dipeptide/oligopeptide/nickel transport system permease component